ncbi:MAG: hypothetical protein MUF87_01040 [Anaerolineae bacterium]|jgi:hypothetical protein|nr:hypothetical protein [Anaerolineae bacterium]
MHFRPARLDDTDPIARLFQARIPVWQRLTPQGQVESLPYAQLTLYQRWTHGGAWMSIETAAIHLSRLLRGTGLAWVAEQDGAIVGYVEAYPGSEPAPFGDHVHVVHRLGESEITADLIREIYRQTQCLITASAIGALPPSTKPIAQVQRYSLAAKTGQGFYKVNEHGNSNAAQIDGWMMTVGRSENATYHWEMLWNRVWEILPEIHQQRTHRLQISASGQEAFLCCQQQAYTPRNADIYLWSPKPLTGQLLTAIRDWAHREGYRTLLLTVNAEVAKVLGTEAELDPYICQSYMLHPVI